MNHRAGQGQHVDDFRQVGQPVDVHRLVVDARRAQQRQQCGELGASANEHCHVVVGVPLQRLPDDPAALFGFACRIRGEQRVDPAISVGIQSGHRFRIGNGAAHRVVRRWQDLGEHGVEPVNEELAGAKVPAQHQSLEFHAADTCALCQQELGDLRIAEAVDRLHGIADTKQRAAIARLPAPGQRFEHAVLGPRRVLHLVDEQVPHLVVEEQRDIPGALGGTEGRAGGQGDLDEVRQPLCAEQSSQFGDRRWQQAEQRKQYRPLLVAVRGRRQGPDTVQQAP